MSKNQQERKELDVHAFKEENGSKKEAKNMTADSFKLVILVYVHHSLKYITDFNLSFL